MYFHVILGTSSNERFIKDIFLADYIVCVRPHLFLFISDTRNKEGINENLFIRYRKK